MTSILITKDNLKSREDIMSISEYRHILKDTKTPDDIIIKRLHYLEAFCKNIIKIELDGYEKHFRNS